MKRQGVMEMRLSEVKLKRLVYVCRLYYEENKTQAEIASMLAVSRPMVSKLLTEARELGIVTIRITEATSFHQMMEERLQDKFSIERAIVLPMEKDEERTDKRVVTAAWALVQRVLGANGCLGLGWGSLIGRMADQLEESAQTENGTRLTGTGLAGTKLIGTEMMGGESSGSDTRQKNTLAGEICPLIGNAAASYRSYHPGELVRVVSKRTGLSPNYIYGPAIAETEAEKQMYENTDSYKQVKELWQRLDAAVVNISNYPSSPDMATALRFGTRLSAEKAVGHMLSYFFNREGHFIVEEDERMLRISREELAGTKHVIALCACGVKRETAAGALATGLITDLILSEKLAIELLEMEL